MHLAFDFDGTICDSLPVYLEMAKKYCLENNLEPVSLASARKMGLKGLISYYHLNPLQISKIILWSRSQLAAHSPLLRPVAGIIPALEKLCVHHSLGIITSSQLDPVNDFLKRNGISHLFSYIESGADLFGKSHKLKKHPVDYYIGDETRDIEAARKTGCKSIAVTWGFEAENLLKLSRPDYVVHTPAELYATLSLSAA